MSRATDPLTFRYSLWKPEDIAFGSGKASKAASKSDNGKPAGMTRFPQVLHVGGSCPQAMVPPDGDTWGASDFRLQKKLASSKTCGVYLAVHLPSRMSVVLKIFCKERLSIISKHQLARELHVHTQLKHDNIVRVYGVFEDHNSVCMILEYAPKGDALQKMQSKASKSLSEREAKDIVLPLLKALDYIHARGLIHRDIKPENVLLGNLGAVKLADFGVCIDTAKERPVSAVGTADYMSPEVTLCPLKSTPSENKAKEHLHYDKATDIWAVGILAYEMVTGFTPFGGETIEEVKDGVMNQPIEIPEYVSAELRHFIQLATNRIPGDRPSALELLQHAWLRAVRSASTSIDILSSKPAPTQPLRRGMGVGLKPTIQAQRAGWLTDYLKAPKTPALSQAQDMCHEKQASCQGVSIPSPISVLEPPERAWSPAYQSEACSMAKFQQEQDMAHSQHNGNFRAQSLPQLTQSMLSSKTAGPFASYRPRAMQFRRVSSDNPSSDVRTALMKAMDMSKSFTTRASYPFMLRKEAGRKASAK